MIKRKNIFKYAVAAIIIGVSTFAFNSLTVSAQVVPPQNISINNIIEVRVPATTTVIADSDGTITISEGIVYLEHDNEPMVSLYTDLDDVLVTDGQHVTCGDSIAKDIDSFKYQVNVDAIVFNYELGITKPIIYPYQYDIADFALQFVGNPYVWGGTSLTSGADCSGFIQTLYKTWGIDIERTASSQYYSAEKISESELRKGDLIFYGDDGDVEHVAMYIGDGKVVHASNSAPYPEGGIKITDNYKYSNIVGYGRY